jgi:DNA processing protein
MNPPARQPPPATEQERHARVALGLLAEPGSLDLWLLVHEVGPVEALQRIRDRAVTPALADLVSPRLDGIDVVAEAERALARSARLGGRFVVPGDAEWPQLALHGLLLLAARRARDNAARHDRDVVPPIGLWARGPLDLAATTARSVAIVGARAATGYGTHVAAELGYGIADREWTVVSGGAYGIDAAAHRGALAAGGGTVAVLACGVDTAYPVGHTNLFERVAEQGLLLSEWPPGASPRRQRFLVRNRVIAALTAGTVVVEAAARSGALATARRAHDLGRVLMGVPGLVTSAMSVGVHQLVRERDARLVTSAAEVVEEVGRIGVDLAARPLAPRSWRDALGYEAQAVVDVLARSPRTAAELAADAGITVVAAERVLPGLVGCGVAVEDGDRYRTGDHSHPAEGEVSRTVVPPVR